MIRSTSSLIISLFLSSSLKTIFIKLSWILLLLSSTQNRFQDLLSVIVLAKLRRLSQTSLIVQHQNRPMFNVPPAPVQQPLPPLAPVPVPPTNAPVTDPRVQVLPTPPVSVRRVYPASVPRVSPTVKPRPSPLPKPLMPRPVRPRLGTRFRHGTLFRQMSVSSLVAQHLFEFCANHIYNAHGKKETIDSLLKAKINSFGKRASATNLAIMHRVINNKYGVRSTDTIEFIHKSMQFPGDVISLMLILFVIVVPSKMKLTMSV